MPGTEDGAKRRSGPMWERRMWRWMPRTRKAIAWTLAITISLAIVGIKAVDWHPAPAVPRVQHRRTLPVSSQQEPGAEISSANEPAPQQTGEKGSESEANQWSLLWNTSRKMYSLESESSRRSSRHAPPTSARRDLQEVIFRLARPNPLAEPPSPRSSSTTSSSSRSSAAPASHVNSPFAEEGDTAWSEWPLLDHLDSAVKHGRLAAPAGTLTAVHDILDGARLARSGLSQPVSANQLLEMWETDKEAQQGASLLEEALGASSGEQCAALAEAGLRWDGEPRSDAFWAEPEAELIVLAAQQRETAEWGERALRWALERLLGHHAPGEDTPPPPPPSSSQGGVGGGFSPWGQPPPPPSPPTPPPAPKPAFPADGPPPPPPPYFLHDMRLRLEPGAPILVLGSGAGRLSANLALRFVNHTVVSVAWPVAGARDSTDNAEEEAAPVLAPVDIHSALNRLLGIPNNPICEHPINSPLLTALHVYSASEPAGAPWTPEGDSTDAKDVAAWSSFEAATGRLPVRWGLIVVEDLVPLVEGLLPHEFERFLGRVLALSRYTAVRSPLPDRQFFSYWPTTNDLAHAAARASGLVARTRDLAPASSSSSSSGGFGQPRFAWGSPPAPPAPTRSSSAGWTVVGVQRPEEAAAESAAYQTAKEVLEQIKEKRKPKEDSKSFDPLSSKKESAPARSAEDQRADALKKHPADEHCLSMRLSDKELRASLPEEIVEELEELAVEEGEAGRGADDALVTAAATVLRRAGLRLAAPASFVVNAPRSAPWTEAGRGVSVALLSEMGLTWQERMTLFRRALWSSPKDVPPFSSPANLWLDVGHLGTPKAPPRKLRVSLPVRPSSPAEHVAEQSPSISASGTVPSWDAAGMGLPSHPSDDEPVGGAERPPAEPPKGRVDEKKSIFGVPSLDSPPAVEDDYAYSAGVGREEMEKADEDEVAAPGPAPVSRGFDKGKRSGDVPPEPLSRSSSSEEVSKTSPAVSEASEARKTGSKLSPSKPERLESQEEGGSPPGPPPAARGFQRAGEASEAKASSSKSSSSSTKSSTAKASSSSASEDSVLPSPPEEDSSRPSSKRLRGQRPPSTAGSGASAPSSSSSSSAGSSLESRLASAASEGERKDSSPTPPGPQPRRTPPKGENTGRSLLGLLVDDWPDPPAAAASTDGAEAALLGFLHPLHAPHPQDEVAGALHREEKWAESHREDQHLLIREEGDIFAHVWPALRAELTMGRTAEDNRWTLMASGAGSRLVAAKVARAFPSSTVLGVVPDRAGVDSLLDLQTLLGLPNLLVGFGPLTDARVRALGAVRDPARFQVLGLDMWSDLLDGLTSPAVFETRLGRLFELAGTTFLPVPDWDQLLSSLIVLQPEESLATRPDLDSRRPSILAAELWNREMAQIRSEWKEGMEEEAGGGEWEDESVESILRSTSSAGAKVHPFAGKGGGRQASVRHREQAASWAGRHDPQHDATHPAVWDPEHLHHGNSQRNAEGVWEQDLRPIKRLLARAAQAAGFSRVSVRTVVAGERGCNMALLRVDVAPWARKRPAEGAQPAAAVPLPSKVTKVPADGVAPREGISLHTLLTLGLVPPHRAELFRHYLDLPLVAMAQAALKAGYHLRENGGDNRPKWTLAPWQVRYQAGDRGTRGSLEVSIVAAKTPESSTPAATFTSAAAAANDVADEMGGDLIWSALSSQLRGVDVASGGAPGKFSFVEWFSGSGVWSRRVAKQFQDATVVSVEPSDALGDEHFAAVLRDNLTNAVLCRHEIDVDLVRSLQKSPEFFRFQMISRSLPSLLRRFGKSDTGSLVGKFLTTAASTFLRMPPSTLLSLGFTTFFHTYPDPEWIAPPSLRGYPQAVAGSKHQPAWRSYHTLPEDTVAPKWSPGIGEAAAFAGLGGVGGGLDSAAMERFAVAFHPRPLFLASELRLLTALARSSESTQVRVTPITADLHAADPALQWAKGGTSSTNSMVGRRSAELADSATSPLRPWGLLESGLVRADVLNVTRHVNHHFQSEIDGHERKYTMRVEWNATATAMLQKRALPKGLSPQAERDAVYRDLAPGNHPNSGGVVRVGLVRDKDGAKIPYDTVQGITLITILRLGLLSPLRNKAYHAFVQMPMYQDMAPWNIVFLGPKLDYIDFDTKDHTYDRLVPKAYEVMEVLFNYKRTVEDFKRCRGKAGNPYNFPFVSECVASDFRGPCPDSDHPVPCGDGTCQTDYVNCLRAMSRKEQGDKGVWAGADELQAESDKPADDLGTWWQLFAPRRRDPQAASTSVMWSSGDWTFGPDGAKN